jgi:hypothetical protein
MMDHVNIAASSTAGACRPYFVVGLVHGMLIT